MSHKPVTHSRPIPMPSHSGLLKRNGRYYLNVRVPKELRPFYKVDIIRKSLGTSDRREAISKVRYEAFKLDAEFAVKRQALKEFQPVAKISAITDKEAHELVFRWFTEREKISEEWWETEGRKFDHVDKEEALDNLRIDELVLCGGNEHYEADSNSGGDVDAFLKSVGLECPKDSPSYQKLLGLFARGRLENVRRNIARLEGGTVKAHEPLFSEVFAHTAIKSPAKMVSVGEMIQRFLKALKEANRSEGTLRTYEVPCRLLREFLGETTPVASVTKDKIADLFALLRRAPTNATKRYRRMTLEQAILKADKNEDASRLQRKTLENYHNNIVAIFNFAVEREMIDKNPARDRLMRASFEQAGAPEKKKPLFSVTELNLLFKAPLFTRERVATGNGRTKKLHLRQGKAWVILLALFHGLRSNEACQLYTEDIKTEEGIPFMEIRPELEDGSASEKRTKGRLSNRRVPVHPEVLKLGFLAFVEERRRDTSHPRLFPDLRRGQRGTFSDAFGKWFARFVDETIGEHCKATFHSLRHMFKDGLVEAGVSEEYRRKLGGWKPKDRSAEEDYGHGPSLRRLKEQIQKLKFAGLDLKHLYAR